MYSDDVCRTIREIEDAHIFAYETMSKRHASSGKFMLSIKYVADVPRARLVRYVPPAHGAGHVQIVSQCLVGL